MVMRGQLMNSVLNQTFHIHGMNTSYTVVTAPTNNSKASAALEKHFDQIGGRPLACIIIKYSVAWVGTACRRRGALVLVDSIDNHRAYSAATLNNEHYRAMDAIIVQTEEHAKMVADWGHVAVVLPHPHGNLGAWSVANTVRRRVRNIGFVAQDNKNMPTREDLRGIIRACCRANVTIYLVSSKAEGLQIHPMNRHHNCTTYAVEEANSDFIGLRAPAPVASMPGLACSSNFDGQFMPLMNDSFPPSDHELRDPTRQRRHYESSKLIDMIDLGLVWRPGNQQGGKIAVDNRPPTRLHWWWSHGIPTIGYPMPAYLDSARRIGYPQELLNLTTTWDVERAILQLASSADRSCLQRAAVHGACLSSPWYTSLELVAAVCALADRCGMPLQPSTNTLRPMSNGICTRQQRRPSGRNTQSEGERRRQFQQTNSFARGSLPFGPRGGGGFTRHNQSPDDAAAGSMLDRSIFAFPFGVQ